MHTLSLYFAPCTTNPQNSLIEFEVDSQILDLAMHPYRLRDPKELALFITVNLSNLASPDIFKPNTSVPNFYRERRPGTVPILLSTLYIDKPPTAEQLIDLVTTNHPEVLL